MTFFLYFLASFSRRVFEVILCHFFAPKLTYFGSLLGARGPPKCPKDGPSNSKIGTRTSRFPHRPPQGSQHGAQRVILGAVLITFGSHFGHLRHILRIGHTSFVFSWDVMGYREKFTFGSPSGHFCSTFGHMLTFVVVSRGMSWDIAEIRLSPSLSRVLGPWDPLLRDSYDSLVRHVCPCMETQGPQ